MNGNNISGEVTGTEISREEADKKMFGREMTGKKFSGEKAGTEPSGSRRFPFGWLLAVAALILFVGHFWSYVPVVRGIVSLLVFSKFLAGLSGTHLLL